METFVWRLQMVWYNIHGAKLWPLYTLGLVVGIPLLIIFRGKILTFLGRLFEISVYVFIVHAVLFALVAILNWLLVATSDPLLPSGGRSTPIMMDLFRFSSRWYDPKGLMWCERLLMIGIAVAVFKFRYTYKKGSGG